MNASLQNSVVVITSDRRKTETESCTDLCKYTDMHQHFMSLSYVDKLSYFDAHFGLIPFSFPGFDTEISWYHDPAFLSLLTENFYKEKPKKFICEKMFVENGKVIKFNIHPFSPVQRIQYNQFIVSAFLNNNSLFRKRIDSDLQVSDNPVVLLTSQINTLNCAEEWIKESVGQLRFKLSLPNQFLQILFSGLNFYYSGKKINIQQRRKFVELYLFSYGFFFADYLAVLKSLLTEIQNTGANIPL